MTVHRPARLRVMPAPLAAPPIGVPALEWLATAVLLQDDERRLVYANAAAENLFELSRRTLTGRTLSELFGPCRALEAAIERACASGASYTEQEVTLTPPGRSPLHLACTASRVDAPGVALLPPVVVKCRNGFRAPATRTLTVVSILVPPTPRPKPIRKSRFPSATRVTVVDTTHASRR